MKKFAINVQEPYLSFILNGTKTIEGRLSKGKFKELSVGDVLVIGSKDFFISGLGYYATFKEMLEKEGLSTIVPDKDHMEDAVEVYYRFYTKEEEVEFGVVAIGLKAV